LKIKILTGLVILILVSQSVIPNSDALKQIAGQLAADLKPGESAKFEWGLSSDNPNESTTIHLSAEGMGSEFLIFPQTIELGPNELIFVEVEAVIPDDFPGDIELTPFLYATEFGEETGATVINIRMLKILSLNIAPNDDSSLWVDWDEILKEETVEPVTEEQEVPESKDATPGFTILQQEEQEDQEPTLDPEPTPDPESTPTQEADGGGCLIATAAFGSELAPQVQMLREIRDNTVMSTASGAAFMSGFNQLYYSFSPGIADLERENPVFKELVKITITPLLTSLSILQYVDVNSENQMLGLGIGLISLNIMMYFVIPTWTIQKITKKLSKK